MKKTEERKVRPLPIMVSPLAHEKMKQDAFKAQPRRTLREHINIINKLPKEA